MQVLDLRVTLRGHERANAMLSLKHRGLGAPTFKAQDAEMLLDDMIARRGDCPPPSAPGFRATMLWPTPALTALRRWAADRRRPRALVFVGDYGEGKSLAIAVAVLHWPVRGEGLPVFTNERDLVQSIRGDASRELERRARAAPLLAIDELGRDDLAAWEVQSLQRWLAERYARPNRYTIVSANPKANDAHAVESRVGAHVWNRWCDRGVSPLVRLGTGKSKPARLRQNPRLRAMLDRYSDELETAYEVGEQSLIAPGAVDNLVGGLVERLKHRADEARRDREQAARGETACQQ